MNYDELYQTSYKLIQNESYKEGLNILLKIQDHSSDAKFLLAYLYEIGVEDILDKNLKKAIEIYKQLINLNHDKALYNLGMLFLRNEEYIEAEYYLTKSSTNGNCSASYWLYRIYSENILNEIEKNKYLKISINQGHLQAKKDFLIEKRTNEKKKIKKIKLTLQIFLLKLTTIPTIIKDPMNEKLN